MSHLDFNPRAAGADPRLTELAHQIEYLHFELNEEEVEHFHYLFANNELKNLTLFRNRRTFRVRLYLGGKQHILGISNNGPQAAAFADLVRLFFWPYRIRDARPPTDEDLNFGLAFAQNNLENYSEAVLLIEKLRDYLEAFGYLPEVSSANWRDRSIRKREREARRTVRGQFELAMADWTAEMHEIAKSIKNIETRLDKIQGIVESLAMRSSVNIYPAPMPAPHTGNPPLFPSSVTCVSKTNE